MSQRGLMPLPGYLKMFSIIKRLLDVWACSLGIQCKKRKEKRKIWWWLWSVSFAHCEKELCDKMPWKELGFFQAHWGGEEGILNSQFFLAHLSLLLGSRVSAFGNNWVLQFLSHCLSSKSLAISHQRRSIYQPATRGRPSESGCRRCTAPWAAMVLPAQGRHSVPPQLTEQTGLVFNTICTAVPILWLLYLKMFWFVWIMHHN